MCEVSRWQINNCCYIITGTKGANNMKIKELLNNYKDLSFEQKLADAKVAFQDLGARMQEAGYSPKEVNDFATMLVRLAAGADKHSSENELRLFEEATGIDTDEYEFFSMNKNASEESFVSAIDEIVDSLKPVAKEAALRFVALFFVVDNELSAKEKELLARLEA